MTKGKFLFITALVLVFGWSPCYCSEKPLANENLNGLYARSIEHILRLDASDIDIATAVLIISEQWNDNVYGKEYVAKLDQMAYEIRRRLKEKRLKANHKAIRVINNYLYDDIGLRSVKEATNPNDLFLHSVMDNKRGYCLSLSILYLALGERLGMPLYGVVVPGHFFVRYDDGKVRFNIEATSRGGTASDEHYITKFNVPEDDGNSIYMLNLNKRQTLGCFFNNLGNSYTEVGNKDSALLSLERAVEINPYLSESRTNLGNIYLDMGDVDDAIFQYRYALRINPKDAKTHHNLGNAYRKREWPDDAISQYKKAIRIDPNFIDAYRNLSSTYLQERMFSEAIFQLQRALKLEPGNAKCYKQMGDTYSYMDDCSQAIEQYERALVLKWDFAEVYLAIGVCYNKMGQIEKEIAAYKNALEINSELLPAISNLAAAYFRQEDYDSAIAQYKRFLRINGGDSVVYYYLASAYSNKEDYKKAIKAYRKAISLDSKMGGAHNGLAFAYYKLKEYELAFKHIKIAEELGFEVSGQLVEAIKDRLRWTM